MTTEQKIKSLKREIAYRKRVYPNSIKSGRMTKEEAEYEIKVFEEILADYEAQVVPVAVNQTSLF